MSTSFNPPQRTLMGPGPSDVAARVLRALARPTVGHLDPQFIDMMDDVKRLLQYAFRTDNTLTLPLSGPGSVGMEAVFVNLIEPGDKVVVCVNGAFGGRMKENVLRAGGVPVVVEDEWGRAVDPDKVEDALRQHPDARALAFVHAETSTGALSDAQTLAAIAHRHDVFCIVDTVTSLGGVPVEVDAWQFDAVYAGTQKCLSCVPGLSPVSFSERAAAHIRARTRPVQSWFLDMNLVMGYWGSGVKRTYHHTAPVNSLYALHESLLMIEEEGIENAWSRHRHHHLALRAGLEAMGLEFLVPETERTPQLNAVRIPAGVDEALVRRRLLDDHDLEIGAGLGPLAGRIWRIGLMGQSCCKRNVLRCLGSLEAVLADLGHAPPAGAATAAAHALYGKEA